MMSREQVKAILDRVLTWPEERQEDAASMLRLMEAQDDGAYRLSAVQAEEIRRTARCTIGLRMKPSRASPP